MILTKSDDWFNYYKSYENSLVTDYFCGQFMSELKCNSCHHSSISFNNFFDISVSFESGTSTYDIVSMIADFLKPESIRDGYCSKEKKGRQSTKQL